MKDFFGFVKPYAIAAPAEYIGKSTISLIDSSSL